MQLKLNNALEHASEAHDVDGVAVADDVGAD